MINEKVSDVEYVHPVLEDSKFNQAIISPIPIRSYNMCNLEEVIGPKSMSPTSKVNNSSSGNAEQDLSAENIRHDKGKFSDIMKR